MCEVSLQSAIQDDFLESIVHKNKHK